LKAGDIWCAVVLKDIKTAIPYLAGKCNPIVLKKYEFPDPVIWYRSR